MIVYDFSLMTIGEMRVLASLSVEFDVNALLSIMERLSGVKLDDQPVSNFPDLIEDFLDQFAAYTERQMQIRRTIDQWMETMHGTKTIPDGGTEFRAADSDTEGT